MEVAIKARVGDADPTTVRELILDGYKIPYISAEEGQLLSKFVNLEDLCINQVGLQSLEHLPSLPQLKSLELQDNQLDDESGIELLAALPELEELLLGGNRIRETECLEPLKKLPKLIALDLDLNPLCDTLRMRLVPQGTMEDKGAIYREEIFRLFPSLKYVDKIDRSGKEMEDDEDDEDEEEEEEDDEEESEGDGSGGGSNDLQAFYTTEFNPEDDAAEGAEENEYVPATDNVEDEEIEDDADEDLADDEESEEGSEEAESSSAPEDVQTTGRRRPAPDAGSEQPVKKQRSEI